MFERHVRSRGEMPGRWAALVGCVVMGMILFAGASGAPRAEVYTAPLEMGQEGPWQVVEGDWQAAEGILEQRNASRLSAALLRDPAWADFTLTVELKIAAVGNGVRAAAIIFRATGTLTYYWLHLDSKNSQVILVRTEPGNNWLEITRRRCELSADEWHAVQVHCQGPTIIVSVDGQEVLRAEDGTLGAGRIGLGTSQGRVSFRNLTIEGEQVTTVEPLRQETPPYKVISRGQAAGVYQAFPDVCRLQNGDIMVVFYAGYGHVSLPNEQYPTGGWVATVRSSDEGRTWTAPQVLCDTPDDDRDPHIAQMSDGTLVCSFFQLRVRGGAYEFDTAIVRSRDEGKTWDPAPRILARNWAVSAPVREFGDVQVLGVYYEKDGRAWGGVLRSTDNGETWSDPIPIGQEANEYLDAETDVIQLADGRLFAALRSSRVNMHYATSEDLGLTWSPARDIGFPGHAPHLTRLSTGEILLSHRVPDTALHVSRDEAVTWQGPYVIDHVIGAYPSTVELRDGTVLAIYYEEGEGSGIRALRFRLLPDGIEPLPLD